MTILSSKDSFKRINLDSLVLNASSDSSISWSSTTGVPKFYLQTSYGGYGSSVSTDMINWNTNNNAFSDMSVKSGAVRLGTGLFLTISSQNWYTSTDGYTWASQGMPNDVAMTGYQSTYVSESPNLVAVNGKYTFFPLGAMIAVTSTDALTWNTINLPIEAWSFTYGGGKYVIQNSMGQTYYSTDLQNWTQAMGMFAVTNAVLIYLNGYYIRYQQGFLAYEFSTDLASWSSTYNLPGWDYNSYTSIVYGNGKFLCNPGYASGPISTSTDLVNWTYISSCPVSENLISFENNKFVYFAKSTPASSYESTDGVTWTNINLDQIGYAHFTSTGGFTTSSLEITSSGIETTENITAGNFFGDGSGLTGI